MPIVDQGRVDLVGDDPAAVPVDDLRQRGELRVGEGPAERVVGAAEQQGAGPGGEGGVDPVEVEGGSAVRSGAHGDVHLGPAGQVDDVEEGHVDWGGDDDRVVRGGEVLQCEPHPMHDIGDDVDVGRVHRRAITAQRPAGIRLGQTAGGGVHRVPEGLGGHGCPDGGHDRFGGRVVHLGDPQGQDVGRIGRPLHRPTGLQLRRGQRGKGHRAIVVAAGGPGEGGRHTSGVGGIRSGHGPPAWRSDRRGCLEPAARPHPARPRLEHPGGGTHRVRLDQAAADPRAGAARSCW